MSVKHALSSCDAPTGVPFNWLPSSNCHSGEQGDEDWLPLVKTVIPTSEATRNLLSVAPCKSDACLSGKRDNCGPLGKRRFSAA